MELANSAVVATNSNGEHVIDEIRGRQQEFGGG